MLNTATSYDVHECSVAAANDDLGAAAAHDLWELADSVLNCVDLSEDEPRYERSLIRFMPEERRLWAALTYLTVVERNGHEAYFASAYSWGYEDARAAFHAMGATDMMQLMERAETAGRLVAYAGDPGFVLEDYRAVDRDIHALNPVHDLRRYARRFRDRIFAC